MRSFLLLGLAGCIGCGRRNFGTDPDSSATSDTVPRANYVFVTSAVTNGALGGLAGGDALCATTAADVGLGGTYVAWLSTSTVNAISRLSGARGWTRPDGRIVADRGTELTTTGPRVPISLTEGGIDVRGVGTSLTFTGTSATGAATAYTCSDWTSALAFEDASVGDIAAGGSPFTNAGQQFPDNCPDNYRLYCFGIDNNVSLPSSPTMHPLAFVTAAVWDPATGITSADSLCAGEASSAAQAGTFRAALSSSTATAASRFAQSRVYYRADGVEVGRVLTEPRPLGFINRHADGTHSTAANVWTGGPPSSISSADCTGWTSNVSSGRVGDPRFSDSRMFDLMASSCAGGLPVYCLED